MAVNHAHSMPDDGADSRAHLGYSQADCERSTIGLRPLGRGRLCPVIWDGWLCWPWTLGGATIKQPCPAFQHFDVRQFAYRTCHSNGTWYDVSDYTLCGLESQATGTWLTKTHNVLPTTGYDAVEDSQDSQPILVSLQTPSLAQFVDISNVSLPADDVIGSVIHGISATCLLLALVLWVTLKLTDRLVTRRYLVLMATIVMAFLFHTIVMTSRMRALAIVAARERQQQHLTATTLPSAGPGSMRLRSRTPTTTLRPQKFQITTTLPRREAAGILNEVEDSVLLPFEHDKETDISVKRRSAMRRTFPVLEVNSDVKVVTKSVISASISSQNTDESEWRSEDRRNRVLHKRNIRQRQRRGTGFASEIREIPGDSTNSREKRDQKHAHHAEKQKGKERNSASRDGDKDSYSRDDEERRNVGEGAGEDDDSTAGDESWLTLCQVGRAFFLLTDTSLYAFLFALSLYYTFVVLSKTLTFNKVAIMFMLGLGLPAAVVCFTVLLYAFLPAKAGAGFGASCSLDALADEFHWATTAPKLLCVVLSMCLMTVCTYGFWRLHVPALRTSSETFYARQGVLKTLALLLSCSLAELYRLVTEYQKMYRWPSSPEVMQTCTALYGLKGVVLAFLFCFIDSEVLHGTCCTHAFSDGEPWLQGAAMPDLKHVGRGRRGGDGQNGGGEGDEETESCMDGFVQLDRELGVIGRRWDETTRAARDHDTIGVAGRGEKI